MQSFRGNELSLCNQAPKFCHVIRKKNKLVGLLKKSMIDFNYLHSSNFYLFVRFKYNSYRVQLLDDLVQFWRDH